MLRSFLAAIPRKMYTSDTRDIDFGTHTTHLVKKNNSVSSSDGRTIVEGTYRIRNFSLVEVDVEIAIRHPRDLVHIAKRLKLVQVSVTKN